MQVIKSNGESYLDAASVSICDEQVSNLVPYGGYRYQGDVDEQITFDASNSYNTNGNITGYRWDFGDGEGYTPWSESLVATHTYEKKGVYLVKLEIKDENGSKRHDIVHADIERSFSSVRDLLVSTGSYIIDEIINTLFDSWQPGQFFYQWFNVKIYYKYVHSGITYENTIPITSSNYLPIDVNGDGNDDVNISGFHVYFRQGLETSPFDGSSQSYQFETILSDIKIDSTSDIKKEDDFMIYLQFTFPQIIKDFFSTCDLTIDPTIKVGYSSEAGQDKPEYITVTHIFRPFLLQALGLFGGNSQSTPSQIPQSLSQEELLNLENQQTTMYSYAPCSVSGTESTEDDTGISSLNLASKTGIGSTVASNNNNQILGQQQTQPIAQDVSEVAPEQGITVQGETGGSFSLLAIVENNQYATTFKITFESLFTDFTAIHRRGGTLYGENKRDMDISGNDTSSVTFSITREKPNHDSATVGMMISPAGPLGLHFEMTRDGDERQATLKIDNPDNVTLFFETENAGVSDGHYFYMEHIPETIGLSWVPKLNDGHIQMTNPESSNFEIGISDDLKNPNNKLFISNVPLNIGLFWQINLGEGTKTVTLEGGKGLTFNAELSLTEPERYIDFQCTLLNNWGVTFAWNPQEGYFSIDQSKNEIVFDFIYKRDDFRLTIDGNYDIKCHVLKFMFNDLEKGVVEFEYIKDNEEDPQLIFNVSLQKTANPQFTLSAKIETGFYYGGHYRLKWDTKFYNYVCLESTHGYITVKNFNLDVPERQLVVKVDELILKATSSYINLSLENSINLKIGGGNQIEIFGLDGTIKSWSTQLAYVKSIGNFIIDIKPADRYFGLQTPQKLELEGIHIIYDTSGEYYDTEFSTDRLNIESGGLIWFDYDDSPTPKLKWNIEGNYIINTTNLHLVIGSGASKHVDFTIPTFSVSAHGSIYHELTSQSLYVNADIDFGWDLQIQTLNLGDWEINGTFTGKASMTLNEWQPGQSGHLNFQVYRSIHHSLKIIHDDLKMEIGNININTYTMQLVDIDWQRGYPGHLYITNNTISSGSISLFKITYPNDYVIELGNLSFNSGTRPKLDWYEEAGAKVYVYLLNNTVNTLNLDLIKITHGTKSVSFGIPIINIGKLRLGITEKTDGTILTIQNSILNLAPSLTYNDTSKNLEWEVKLTSLNHDFNKVVSLAYNETLKKITLDSNNESIAQWVQFTIIKNNVGRRLALYGLKVDDFYIDLDANGHWEGCGGKIYLANRLVYSKLINNEWRDLDIQWDLQNASGLKSLTFDSEFDLTINLVSLELLGVELTSFIDLPADHLGVQWKLIAGVNEYKEFHFDTNNDTLAINFYFMVGELGLDLVSPGIRAENFYVKWRLWPPELPEKGGFIEYEEAALYGTRDGGANWYQIWPRDGGGQPE
ncbi:MAG: PKD domain-containing protein [Euryarchaeota archaeon]|nr:PKD domain-containing protein [Euryarchaeota archaeon]